MKSFREIKCPTLFTTHYTELTELAAEQDNGDTDSLYQIYINDFILVSNYHVSALVEDEKLTLLYQLQSGVCSKSFGVDVAKIAHFPDTVIRDARRRISRLEGVLNDTNQGEAAVRDFLDRIKKLEDVSNDEELVKQFTLIQNEVKMGNSQYVQC